MKLSNAISILRIFLVDKGTLWCESHNLIVLNSGYSVFFKVKILGFLTTLRTFRIIRISRIIEAIENIGHMGPIRIIRIVGIIGSIKSH